MFIDFLTVIMINLVAGTVLLAYYLWKGIDEKDQRPYAPAFFMVGLLSFITGLQLAFTWPLPGSYNIAYGDASILFGVVFLATGLSLWQGWNLLPVTIYAFFRRRGCGHHRRPHPFAPARKRTSDRGCRFRAGRSWRSRFIPVLHVVQG